MSAPMHRRMGSLFSGIDGFALGVERALAVHTVFQAEVDPFCRAVLEKHWPSALCFGDVAALDPDALPDVEVLIGGPPCQPASHGGKRKGRNDERWMWPAFAAVLRAKRPKLVMVENVPGLLSVDRGHGFTDILRDFASLGYHLEWFTVLATDVGAPHRRERVFLIAWLPDADMAAWARVPAQAPRWGHPGFPGLPDEPQHEYEPRRMTQERFNRRPMLKSLGNAVVPHNAYAVARIAASLLRGEVPEPTGKVLGAFVARADGAWVLDGRQLQVFGAPVADAATRPWPRAGSMRAGVVRVGAKRRFLKQGEWPTPTAQDATGSRRATARKPSWTSKPGTTLTDAAVLADRKIWPTPTTESGAREHVDSWLGRRDAQLLDGTNPKGRGMPLAIAVQAVERKIWPTPSACVANDGERPETWLARHEKHRKLGVRNGMPLSIATQLADDPVPATEPVPLLNARWVELLMGFAIGWTDVSVDMVDVAKKAAAERRAVKKAARAAVKEAMAS